MEEGEDDEREGLRASGEGIEGRDGEVMWDVGEASEDDDDDDAGTGERTPRATRSSSPSTAKPASNLGTGGNETEEGMHLMRTSHDEDRDGDREAVAASTSTHTLGPQPHQTRRRSASSVSLIDADEEEMEAEFGEFKSSGAAGVKQAGSR